MQTSAKELGILVEVLLVEMMTGSSGAKSFASSHIDVKWLWLEHVVAGVRFRVSQVAGALKPADILAKYKRIRGRRESNELPEAVTENELELMRPIPCARKLLPIIFQMRQLRITIQVF